MSPLPTLKMFENVWNFKIGSFYVEENVQSGTFIYLQRNLSKNTPDFLQIILLNYFKDLLVAHRGLLIFFQHLQNNKSHQVITFFMIAIRMCTFVLT